MHASPAHLPNHLLRAILAAVLTLREVLLRLRGAGAFLLMGVSPDVLRGRVGPSKGKKVHRGAPPPRQSVLGVPPPRPSVLGVVAAESSFGGLEDQGVCRLLSW